MATAKILVVDDDGHLNDVLVELMRGAGYEAEGVLSAESALERFRQTTFHLVLCDLQLPGRNGISLIRALREACPATQMILITGHGTIRAAVTALKRGAVEFMLKPVKPKRLLAVVRALLADPPAYLPNRLLAADLGETRSFDGMVARSRSMLSVFERIQLAASADTTVLIIGESGTGKELVARSIHQRSSRANGPFVALHTGAIPQGLIASELFGHEKGAFTGAAERKPGKFELAENGTLFLDEISTMDEQTQIGLLRVLESFRFTRVGGRRERGANVRVLAASNRDLEAMVAAGEFREDLFFRLNIFSLNLPPLRERPEDIAVLGSEFAREFGQKYAKPQISIPAETQRILSQYAWPGNVRELRNVVEQAVLLSRGASVEPHLLPQMMHKEAPREDVLRIPIGTTMSAIEKEVILRTLAAHKGNKTATAEALGISRRSIYNKLAEYGIHEGVLPGEAQPTAAAAAAGGGSQPRR